MFAILKSEHAKRDLGPAWATACCNILLVFAPVYIDVTANANLSD